MRQSNWSTEYTSEVGNARGLTPLGKNSLIPEEMILRENPNLVVESVRKGVKSMVSHQEYHHTGAGTDGFCLSLTTFMVGHHKCHKLPQMTSLRSWFLPKAGDLHGAGFYLRLTTFVVGHQKYGKLPRISSHRSWILPKANDLRGISHEEVMRFGKKEKLSPQYVGPYLVLRKVGVGDSSLVVPLENIGISDSLSYEQVLVLKVKKIMVNCGIGDAAQNSKGLDATINTLALITWQRPVKTRAKNAIATFTIREINHL
ncbi:50S ribosomal protein L5, chloroplastic [Capsicum baccatum]|uniref:50S ribosomal protein L5, chloroplastic n=1 Tax=Capsicum baccatum TaxID=33114 RepID=A0A2G2VXB3_CAPBA|nr:50S ribosomal protein L5, chloroplastic [Capsicum baccatum]